MRASCAVGQALVILAEDQLVLAGLIAANRQGLGQVPGAGTLVPTTRDAGWSPMLITAWFPA